MNCLISARGQNNNDYLSCELNSKIEWRYFKAMSESFKKNNYLITNIKYLLFMQHHWKVKLYAQSPREFINNRSISRGS